MRDAPRRQIFGSSGDPTLGPVEVVCDSVLCRLQVRDEAAWATLPESERPLRVEHVPGLGWVGAVPVRCMN